MKKGFSLYSIKLVKSKTVPYDSTGVSINNASIAAEVARLYYSGTDREIFSVLLLNTKNQLIGANIVSVGNLNSSLVHPREVFKPAILANALQIILVHNHPSGDPTPSREDIEITRRMIQAGNLLDIPVIDHIILAEDRYASIRERGLAF
ncbi:MAG: JAB domain-containing protein [Firmicutes bacterium]|nr:JAB domain-containing protein [Bacillota bacterium]